MKVITVSGLKNVQTKAIEDISAYMDKNLTFHYLDMLPWPSSFPYKPECKFKIVHDEQYLYIRYYVAEKIIRALFTKDQEPVWQDSCVEFFCKSSEQDTYSNFEFNCIGTCLAATRTGRNENIVPFSNEQMASIVRLPDLGKQPFPEKKGFFSWTLTVAIPLNLIGVEPNVAKKQIRANFYKCADGTEQPHYIAWNNIVSLEPDFHLPLFFGTLILE